MRARHFYPHSVIHTGVAGSISRMVGAALFSESGPLAMAIALDAAILARTIYLVADVLNHKEQSNGYLARHR